MQINTSRRDDLNVKPTKSDIRRLKRMRRNDRKKEKMRERRKKRKRRNIFEIITRAIVIFYGFIFLIFALLIIFGDDTEDESERDKIEEVSDDYDNSSYDGYRLGSSDADYSSNYYDYSDYEDGDYLDISGYDTDNLDEILYYVIYVRPDMTDGSLYITYDIRWLVLDSGEDEVTWVKIGIPNKYTEDIEAVSDNIEKIKYISDSGDYVRIDFDDSYEEGQIIDFSFSIHAHQLYHETGSVRRYDFTPGWFDEIDVEYIEVRWDVSQVTGDIEPRCTDGNIKEDDGIVSFYGSLPARHKFKTTIDLPDKAFEDDDTYSEELKEDKTGDVLLGIFVVVFLALICGWPFIGYLIFYIKAFFWSVDAYQKGKMNTFATENSIGDYMRKYRKQHHIEYCQLDNKVHSYYQSSGRGHHGGGGCACACACACAGGGRAGCSTKDFYGTLLTTEQIHRVHRVDKD